MLLPVTQFGPFRGYDLGKPWRWERSCGPTRAQPTPMLPALQDDIRNFPAQAQSAKHFRTLCLTCSTSVSTKRASAAPAQGKFPCWTSRLPSASTMLEVHKCNAALTAPARQLQLISTSIVREAAGQQLSPCAEARTELGELVFFVRSFLLRKLC